MVNQGNPSAKSGARAAATQPEDAWDLGAILAVLRRRQRFILLAVLMSTALGALIAFRSPVLWPAKATLMLQSDATRLLSSPDPLGVLALSEEFFQTQYRRITSRSVLQRAIEAAGITEWPEFQGENDLPQHLAREIELKPIRDSRLVEVSYEGPNAVHAARLVDAVIESFSSEFLEARHKEAAAGITSLGGSLEQAEAEVNRLQEGLRRYMQDNGLVTTDPAFSVPHIALQELTRRETALLAECFDLDAQVGLLHKAAPSLHELLSLDGVATQSRLQAYDQSLTSLLLEREKMLRVFDADSPEVRTLDRQLDAVRNGQRLVAQQLVASIKARRDRMRAALKETAAEKGRQKDAVQALNQQFVEVERLRGALRQAQDRCQEILVGRARGQVFGQMAVHPVVVVERPAPAQLPSKPRKCLILALALLAGLTLGVGLAFVLEVLDDSVVGAEHLEKATALQCLAVVPHMKGVQDFAMRLKVVREHPHVLASEAVRALRATLDIALPPKPGTARVFLISSAQAGEGKTTLATNLGLAMTHNERRVLLVDADMRHRTDFGRQQFFEGEEFGLAECLAGEHSVEECIRPTVFPGFDILPAGKTGKNAGDLVGHVRMEQLVTWARKVYDVVILDSPPVLLVSDALVLSPLADCGVVIVNGGKTPRAMVAQACRILQQGGFPLAGTVLNDASGALLRASGRYGYYYAHRYGYGYGYGYGHAHGAEPSAARTKEPAPKHPVQELRQPQCQVRKPLARSASSDASTS